MQIAVHCPYPRRPDSEILLSDVIPTMHRAQRRYWGQAVRIQRTSLVLGVACEDANLGN